VKDEQNFDLIILGGGPAGMTAAIYAAHANINAVLLEKNITGGLVNSTDTVQNFPSQKSIHGMNLMEQMRDHVDSLNVLVEEVCEVHRLELTGDVKTIKTDETIFKAKAVILSTGREPIHLDVSSECDQVHYCAICDASPYKGKNILVVGGGNSAFDESRYMLKSGIRHITLIEMMDRFFAAQATQDKLFSTGKVKADKNTRVADLIMENDKLTGVILENISTGERKNIPVDGIFVFIGQNPSNELFKDQVTLSDNGYIITKEDMSTNISGVFGAGDINEKIYRQITTAMSDGTVAALSVERYLRDK